MCWVLGAWFNMAKNAVLLCKVPVDKKCVLTWTVCDYLCWPYCAVFALIFNPCYRSYDVIRVVFDLRNQQQYTYLAFQGVSSGDKGGLEGAVCSFLLAT